MIERFGKDTIIALSTVENGIPYVRYVDAYYENGAFYIITYALSDKMKHIENNFDDVNTIILCVKLTDGLLLSNGPRYEF